MIDDRAQWEIEKEEKQKRESLQKKYHSRLYTWITKTGESSPKRHGKYWTTWVNGVKYHLDDYSSAIHINDFYVGTNFGGDSFSMEPDMYRHHIGLLYKHWLKNKMVLK